MTGVDFSFESEEMGNESHGWERYGDYISLILLLVIVVGGALHHLWSEGGSFVENSVTKADD